MTAGEAGPEVDPCPALVEARRALSGPMTMPLGVVSVVQAADILRGHGWRWPTRTTQAKLLAMAEVECRFHLTTSADE